MGEKFLHICVAKRLCICGSLSGALMGVEIGEPLIVRPEAMPSGVVGLQV